MKLLYTIIHFLPQMSPKRGSQSNVIHHPAQKIALITPNLSSGKHIMSNLFIQLCSVYS